MGNIGLELFLHFDQPVRACNLLAATPTVSQFGSRNRGIAAISQHLPVPGIVLVALHVVGDTLFPYEYLIANVERGLKLGFRGNIL